MKILVTGFDPFGGETINPAYEAVKKLPATIENSQIFKLEIPTVFKKSVEKIIELDKQENFDVIISVGQAGGRFEITPERVAINIDDARIKDNEGNQPIDQKIELTGENAYFTTLPVKAMVQSMKEGLIPASVSNTAGTFVCNHVMYGVLHYLKSEQKQTRAGFIHVPYATDQIINKSGMPSLSIEQITKGLELAIKAVIKNEKDLQIIGGKLD